METFTDNLSREDLVRVLRFCDDCVECSDEETLHEAIMDLAGFLGFEFVLYAYMKHIYEKAGSVHLVNLSNPVEWMEEYHQKNYVVGDPVRMELEARLAVASSNCSIVWDAYERPLSAREVEIIERRSRHGLKYGFSAFNNSATKNALFLISFASELKIVDQRTQDIGRIIIPHLNLCRKRLDLLLLVKSLTHREKTVAEWLVEGKTNWEIAAILQVTESTVKYHIANVFRKLHVTNRQMAVSILLAIRLLS